MLLKLALIGLGGAVGSILRYLVSGWTQFLSGGGVFPYGTLVVNTSGCLIAGFVGTLLTEYWLIREEYRLAILIGVLGGYTTFSTFGRETLTLFSDKQYVAALVNVLLNNACCLTAILIGHRLAQKWYGL